MPCEKTNKLSSIMSRWLLIIYVAASVMGQRDTVVQLNELAKTDFGRKIVKQLQFVYRSQKNNPMDTIFTLNNMENDLVAQIEKDMKQYQQQQQKNIEGKQEAKQQIFLNKYAIQNMGEEISMLENEVKFSEDIFHQRQELITDQARLIPQLVALKNDEETRMESYYPELLKSQDFVASITQLILKIAESVDADTQNEGALQGQSYVEKQKGFMDNAPAPTSLGEAIKELQRFYQSQLKRLSDTNPYTKIIGSFMPMLIQQNLSQVLLIQEILSKLQDEIQLQIDSLLEMSNVRKTFFTEQRNRLKTDSDKWTQEINTIEPFSKVSKAKLDKLRIDLELSKEELTDLQGRVDEVQKQHDNLQLNYENKHKAQLQDLSTMRQFKQLVYENQDEFENHIQNKMIV